MQDKAPEDDTLHAFYLEAVKSIGVLAQDIAYYNRLPDDHADRSYHWLYNMVNHYLARTRKEAVTANIRKGLGPLLAPLNQTQRGGTVAALEDSTYKKEPKGKGKGKGKTRRRRSLTMLVGGRGKSYQRRTCLASTSLVTTRYKMPQRG